MNKNSYPLVFAKNAHTNNRKAIDRESLYKRKFGIREFGYNNN